MVAQKTSPGLVRNLSPLVLCFLVLWNSVGYSLNLPSEQNFKKLKSKLQSKTGDYQERIVERIGNNTFSFDAYVSTEVDWSSMKSILSDFSTYSKWMLKNINDRPGGGKYYVQIKDLKGEPTDPHLLNAHLSVTLPAVKMDIDRKFRTEVEEKDGVFSISLVALAHDSSPVQSMQAYIQFFRPQKSGSRVWAYCHALITLKHWLLYESLPDRLLKRESGERIQIILDNYLAEENRKAQIKETKP